jgi:hypothetical protein
MVKLKIEIQSITFNKDKYTTQEARNWLKRNNFKAIKRVDKTKSLLRYRINKPGKYKRFRTQKVGGDIMFVYGLF